MNLYTSDLHFGHRNVISFDHRPFIDVDEMDHTIISLWNSRVSNDDDVYVIGDFSFKSDREYSWYLQQLKGHKHLVIGNHDRPMMQDARALSYFESVEHLAYVQDVYEHEHIDVFLCHYPLATWNRAKWGSWHIYGHIHGNRDEVSEYMSRQPHALNAWCGLTNWTPASFRELVEANRRYYGTQFSIQDSKHGISMLIPASLSVTNCMSRGISSSESVDN